MATDVGALKEAHFLSFICSPLLPDQNITDNFNEILEKRNIEDSSTSYDFLSDKQVQFVPDAASIKLLKPLQEIYKSFLLGSPLDDKDRNIIAEAVIEECLKNKPEKVLKCYDFKKLAENIIDIFPSENVSTYYLWHKSRRPSSGKLFYAYNKQLAGSVETKEKIKPKTKKIPMTSTERSRKWRARNFGVNHKKKIRNCSANTGDTLATENVDTEFSVAAMEVTYKNVQEQDVTMEMDLSCISENDDLTKTRKKTQMKTKKKSMTSAQRTRKHRARKYLLNNMESLKISSSAGIDDFLATENIDTQLSVEHVINKPEKNVTMEMQQKRPSEKDVLARTKTKTTTKPKSSTERSRLWRARKYQLHNMENMNTSSSASIDDSVESVVKAAWY